MRPRIVVWRAVTLGFLLVFQAVSAAAAPSLPPRFAGRWRVIDTWRQPDGLQADHDGGVWIATKSGVHTVQAGRIERVVFPAPRPTAVIEAVLRERQGALWVGTLDGLYRFADGITTRYTTADGLSSNSVHRLDEDPGRRPSDR